MQYLDMTLVLTTLISLTLRMADSFCIKGACLDERYHKDYVGGQHGDWNLQNAHGL